MNNTPHIYTTRIYLASKSLNLLQIIIPDESSMREIDQTIKLRNHILTPITKIFDNELGNNKPFYIKIDTSLNKNSKKDLPIISFIKNIYQKIENKDIKKIQNLKNLTELNNYNFVLYVGYKNPEERNKSNQPSRLAIFPLEKRLIAKKSHLCVIKHESKFIITSNKKYFQLPANSSQNIANLYITNNTTSKLEIYHPLAFDEISTMKILKKQYIKNIFSRFNKGNKGITKSKGGLTLTKNKVRVSFSPSSHINSLTKIFEKEPRKYKLYIRSIKSNQTNIGKKIQKQAIFNNNNKKKKDYLINNLSMFTGNGNNTIQSIPKQKLQIALLYLRKYASKQTNHQFNSNNIPYIPNSKKAHTILVTEKSLPIFCSLLRNKIITRVLTQKTNIPYYNL